MEIQVERRIEATRERVWSVITDHGRWADWIRGIEEIVVLEQPAEGLVGLRWRETRTMMGRKATETMWISACEPKQWYDTTAHNHGMVYTTRVSISDADDGAVVLGMRFRAEAQNWIARLMSVLGRMMAGSLRTALEQDLEDLAAAAEQVGEAA